MLQIVNGGGCLKLKKLKRFRGSMGLNSKEMAAKLDISPSLYSAIENGKRKPTLALAYKLQDIFGVDNVLGLLEEEE